MVVAAAVGVGVVGQVVLVVLMRGWVGKEKAEGPVIWMSGIIVTIGMPSGSVLLLGWVGVDGWNGWWRCCWGW